MLAACARFSRSQRAPLCKRVGANHRGYHRKCSRRDNLRGSSWLSWPGFLHPAASAWVAVPADFGEHHRERALQVFLPVVAGRCCAGPSAGRNGAHVARCSRVWGVHRTKRRASDVESLARPALFVSRVLFPASVALRGTATIHLGHPSPNASCDLPRSSGGQPSNAPIRGLALDGVCLATTVTSCAVGFYSTVSPLPATPKRCGRSIFCCTFLEVTPTGRYPASCPIEPGLSSRGPKPPSGSLNCAGPRGVPEIVRALQALPVPPLASHCARAFSPKPPLTRRWGRRSTRIKLRRSPNSVGRFQKAPRCARGACASLGFRADERVRARHRGGARSRRGKAHLHCPP